MQFVWRDLWPSAGVNWNADIFSSCLCMVASVEAFETKSESHRDLPRFLRCVHSAEFVFIAGDFSVCLLFAGDRKAYQRPICYLSRSDQHQWSSHSDLIQPWTICGCETLDLILRLHNVGLRLATSPLIVVNVDRSSIVGHSGQACGSTSRLDPYFFSSVHDVWSHQHENNPSRKISSKRWSPMLEFSAWLPTQPNA